MHAYSAKRPADKTIVAGLLIAATLTGGAAIGLSHVDFGGSPTDDPAPTVETRVPVQLPTLDDGPVPGMPAGTHARLTAEQRRQAILDTWPEPRSTPDEFSNSLGL